MPGAGRLLGPRLMEDETAGIEVVDRPRDGSVVTIPTVPAVAGVLDGDRSTAPAQPPKLSTADPPATSTSTLSRLALTATPAFSPDCSVDLSLALHLPRKKAAFLPLAMFKERGETTRGSVPTNSGQTTGNAFSWKILFNGLTG
jgi:hypothetical protein